MSDPAASVSSLHTLYNDHHGWLHGLLRRRLGCPERAADLAQDTFVSVITSSAIGQIREPRSFLATVARRLVANWYRRQALETAYLEYLAALPEAVAPSPEQQLEALQLIQEIDAAIDGLPLAVKQAFLLAHLDELSYLQIAERLGISPSTVKKYLMRANRQCLFALAP